MLRLLRPKVRKGQGLAEYAIVLALVIGAAVVAMQGIKTREHCGRCRTCLDFGRTVDTDFDQRAKHIRLLLI